jgi:SnoaL-like domain
MKRRTEMVEMSIGMQTLEGLVFAILEHRTHGNIDDAIAGFAEEFSFKDHGIGLEFTDKERLAEFFQRARDLYPDSLLQTDAIFVSGDRVITQWTLQGNILEPSYARLSRKIPVSVHGASIVRISNGKVAGWSDYYDGLASRRSALALYFTEWVEL